MIDKLQGRSGSWPSSTVMVIVSCAMVAIALGCLVTVLPVGTAAWLLLPTVLGTAPRVRAAYLDAECAREAEVRRRVTEERMRIARDLHDVVAHHLVLANIQAGAVVKQLPGRPEEALRIASVLSGTTATALRELKSTVGLLRQTADAERPLDPTPGLAQLPDLAGSFRSAGLEVTVITEGVPEPLSAGTDLTAYRIAQEALTNVTKHAATRAAEVRLVYSRGRLTVTVANDGGAAPAPFAPPGGGYGVMGMRERARSAGGRFRAGPRDHGGFEVVTELPLGADRLEASAAR
ncbi:sensor histidine kinase [Streptomyces sp. NBC_01613]|uniref:sensor histidine kinase n=1 Tax=Streptomyces sp. NBC_01613 TaxID=2975896 RepID=UPI00386D5D60